MQPSKQSSFLLGALLAAGTGGGFAILSVLAPPPVSAESNSSSPTLTVGNVTDNSATLTIANHTGNWYYKEISSDTSPCTLVTGASANLTDLKPDWTHWYRAYSDSGCSTPITSWKTFRTKPGTVTMMAVTGRDRSIHVTWISLNTTGYKVQWKTSGQDYSTTRQNTVTNASTTITGLTNDVTYTVRVIAYSHVGDGSPSAEVSATPAASTATLTASAVQDTTATLTIANHTGNWYHKSSAWDWYYESGVWVPVPCMLVTGASANLTSLIQGAKYTYRAFRDSDCSTEIASETFLTRPGRVTDVEVTPGNGSLSVDWPILSRWDSWTVLSGQVTGYKVQWKTSSQNYNATRQNTVTSVKGPRVPSTITGLTNGVAYTVRVIAYNDTGDGKPSSEFSSTPLASAVTLTASAVEDATATLTIANHTGNWYYKYVSPFGGSCSSTAVTGSSVILSNLAGNTDYIFKAYSDSDCTTKLAASTFLTKPDKPTRLTVTAGPGSSEVTLASTLSGGSGALTRWEYTKDDGTTWVTVSDTDNTLSHVVSDLTNGTSYTFKVRAVNSTGTGPASDASYAPMAPEAVAAVTVVHQGSSLDVSWPAPVRATHYHVTYTGDNGVSWQLGASEHVGTSLTISGVDSTKTYMVGVRAKNVAGYSDWTNSAAATLPAPPDPVAAVTAVHQGSSLAVTWPAAARAASYHVTYTGDNGVSWQLGASERVGTSLTISGVDSTKTYMVGVRAKNVAGYSDWTNSATATFAVPDPVATVTVVHQGSSLAVTWPVAARAASYHVTYTGDNGTSWQLGAAAHTSTSLTISGADSTKTYMVAVRAKNAAGYSDWTNSAAATLTAPDPVASVTAVHKGTSLDVSWPESVRAASYHVTYTGDNATTWQLGAAAHTSTSLTINGVDSTKTYTVGVRAKNAVGSSGWVNSAPAAPPALSIADATASEPPSGEGTSTTLDFVVTLNRAASGTVTVDYATSDGTATAGADYTATSGTPHLPAGRDIEDGLRADAE